MRNSIEKLHTDVGVLSVKKAVGRCSNKICVSLFLPCILYLMLLMTKL